MGRLTEPTIGCFKYTLAKHEPVIGEFGTYEAFFDYSMAVKRLGEYEDIGTIEKLEKNSKIVKTLEAAFSEGALVIIPEKIYEDRILDSECEIENVENLINWFDWISNENER